MTVSRHLLAERGRVGVAGPECAEECSQVHLHRTLREGEAARDSLFDILDKALQNLQLTIGERVERESARLAWLRRRSGPAARRAGGT